MLVKRHSHLWLATRGRKTQVPGNCLCKLCLAETILVRQREDPALAQFVKLRVNPDRSSRLVWVLLKSFH